MKKVSNYSHHHSDLDDDRIINSNNNDDPSEEEDDDWGYNHEEEKRKARVNAIPTEFDITIPVPVCYRPKPKEFLIRALLYHVLNNKPPQQIFEHKRLIYSGNHLIKQLIIDEEGKFLYSGAPRYPLRPILIKEAFDALMKEGATYPLLDSRYIRVRMEGNDDQPPFKFSLLETDRKSPKFKGAALGNFHYMHRSMINYYLYYFHRSIANLRVKETPRSFNTETTEGRFFRWGMPIIVDTYTINFAFGLVRSLFGKPDIRFSDLEVVMGKDKPSIRISGMAYPYQAINGKFTLPDTVDVNNLTAMLTHYFTTSNIDQRDPNKSSDLGEK